MTLKEFEEIDEDTKAAISEIQVTTKTIKIGEDDFAEVEMVKFKMHDKQKALSEIKKQLGYDKPEVKKITGTGENGEIVVINESRLND